MNRQTDECSGWMIMELFLILICCDIIHKISENFYCPKQLPFKNDNKKSQDGQWFNYWVISQKCKITNLNIRLFLWYEKKFIVPMSSKKSHSTSEQSFFWRVALKTDTFFWELIICDNCLYESVPCIDVWTSIINLNF